MLRIIASHHFSPPWILEVAAIKPVLPKMPCRGRLNVSRFIWWVLQIAHWSGINTYACVYVYLKKCVFEYMYICKYVHVYMCIYESMYIYIYMYSTICRYVDMYICVFVNMSICIYANNTFIFYPYSTGTWGVQILRWVVGLKGIGWIRICVHVYMCRYIYI